MSKRGKVIFNLMAIALVVVIADILVSGIIARDENRRMIRDLHTLDSLHQIRVRRYDTIMTLEQRLDSFSNAERHHTTVIVDGDTVDDSISTVIIHTKGKK